MQICDKCGGAMTYPLDNVRFPNFYIRKGIGFAVPDQEISLCPKCSVRFDAWLKARPVKPIHIKGFDYPVCGKCRSAPVFGGDMVCGKCGTEIKWEEDSDASR